ncbi:YbaK/EbsC family protein [Halopelagius longus]|uniref:Cys-tRNA(Pro) deacylase, prolyl-tRNA editing enzyme YbaK/EbsC n=1 Tax=Halopelagius longus TaxID=1236180 RepID=A0A1H1BQJ5_9EURY|nr:YbaK/EbsC family protein [Halopelagius longus]RDI70862.1 YbaK/EbsC family protein [Halopelagius longus]SDQ53666.1 Cys-tRNA(Pro) deacylase, prolyl-tRNA editing enzyme YbaK/EbsC [Halopelagius longus]
MHQRARTFAREASERYDFEVTVEEFPEGTKTAADAADAVGCDVGQIASSLVFDCDGELVVVVTSGANRVSEAKLAAHLGLDEGDVSMADPEEIREVVGWSIGGVPPFCHETDLRVLFDESLSEYDTVWGAAGTPSAMFPVSPEELRRLADATPADVAE